MARQVMRSTTTNVEAFEAHKTFLFLFNHVQFYDKNMPYMDSYIVR